MGLFNSHQWWTAIPYKQYDTISFCHFYYYLNSCSQTLQHLISRAWKKKKKVNASLPFGQAAPKFCLPLSSLSSFFYNSWQTTCLRPCPSGKWEWKDTCLAGKSTVTDERTALFFSPVHWMSILGKLEAYQWLNIVRNS